MLNLLYLSAFHHLEHVAQFRDEVVDFGWDFVIGFRQNREARHQVFRHCQQWKYHPPLLHRGDHLPPVPR